MVKEVAQKFSVVITIENNTILGGFGSAVAEILSESAKKNVLFQRFGLPDKFVPHGSIKDLLYNVKLDVENLVNRIESFMAQG